MKNTQISCCNDERVDAPPDSDVSAWTGYIGLAGVVLGLFVVYWWRPSTEIAWGIFMGAGIFPMMLAEYWRHRHWESQARQPVACTRLQIIHWKLKGVLPILLLWVVTLVMFYVTGVGVVSTLILFLSWMWPVLLIGFIYYLCRNDNADWEDGTLLSLGYALDQQGHHWSVWKDVVRNHFVKAFFLPLMIDFSFGWVNLFYKELDGSLTLLWYFLPLTLFYLIDTVFGTIGYIGNSRRLGTHIRSSNPYWQAWFFALVCYPPLQYLRRSMGLSSYGQDDRWWLLLDGGSLSFYAWGVSILVFTAIYAWATVIFGLRFSNLTNRGIITNGPYRYFKHPAYWSKNLSWWFLFAPLLKDVPIEVTLQMVAGLLLTNLIYWFRAKTEEKHLMHDPKYQAYSRWIARYGVWGRLKSFVCRGQREV